MFFRLILVVPACVMMASCATVSMLPKSASEVAAGQAEGKVGWSKYREEAFFENVTLDQAYEAAKAGLGAASFSLRKGDKALGMVIGEHGITFKDWNVMAGVYLKQEARGVRAIVIVEGSKDVGITGDGTSFAWTAEILQGMRSFLQEGKRGASVN